MSDIFDLQNLFPELILGIGLALLVGNGMAWWKHHRGETPKGVEGAVYRPARVRFLIAVGIVMIVWGAVSLFG